MIVLDASAALELVLRTAAGRAVARRIAPASETLHAPHVIDLEVAQVLRRYAAGKQMTTARAREALDDFLDLDLNRYPHDLLIPRIWDLRDNVTAYDAAYLALGEALGAPVLTRDRRLCSVPRLSTRVELV
jgi:predicted nucleic acid-binding protein